MTDVGGIRSSLAALLREGTMDLPLPGGGDTAARHRSLIELARRRSVGVARLVEAHVDAVAILREAGREPHPESVYGVWASSGRDGGPVLRDGVVDGTKRFCSGLGIVDRALLVAADDTGAQQLIDVAARPGNTSDGDAGDGDTGAGDTITVHTTAWSTVALASTSTGDITYTGHEIGPDALVGAAGWYLDRPGFWHGACGPAACWAGATFGLIDVADALTGEDPHQQAHLGAMHATMWSLETLFDGAGRQIDDRPDDRDAAERSARSLRHTTERLCSDVLDRFSRAFGPRPFVSDAATAQRHADIHLYLRQHHAERELAALATCSRRSASES